MLTVVRIIGAIIIVAFLVSLGSSSGDIDKPWLGDHFSKSSVIDLLGVILTVAGAAFITGLVSLFKGGEDVYQYGQKSSGWKNVGIGAGMFLAGVLLIWLS